MSECLMHVRLLEYDAIDLKIHFTINRFRKSNHTSVCRIGAMFFNRPKEIKKVSTSKSMVKLRLFGNSREIDIHDK